MRNELLRDIFWGLFMLFMQLAVFRHLQIFGIQADVVLIYCLYQINRRNRTTALLLAAGVGLLQDAFLDLWGMNLFSKTLTVYILSYIIRATEEVRMPTVQVFAAVFASSFLHNLIFLLLAYFSESYSANVIFWSLLLGSSLYSAMIATLLHLFKKV
jgi:rod shape-determining protein MreD